MDIYIYNFLEVKYLSWNVNGLRAILKKDFFNFLESEDPDIIGLQEIKGRPEQLLKKDQEYFSSLPYYLYFNPAERPGYSGTAVFSKKEAQNVYYGINTELFDISNLKDVDETLTNNHEGRVITLEFENHYFITVYTPNSKDDLSRLPYRYYTWDIAFGRYIKALEKHKPVVVCGDLNVAHKPIDLARPKQNTLSAGFTREEREGMDNYVSQGLTDTFRFLYPDATDIYSWWSYRAGARARNVGWRIDYFLVSELLRSNIQEAKIRDDILGSDHCPVELHIDV